MSVGVVQMMISTHHDGLLTLYWREQMWLMNYVIVVAMNTRLHVDSVAV